ncbi:hypothetical protein [Pseudomonas sp. 28 E 9]|nr:hypothetical protein EUX53_11625 [Pseudomonas orientalis]CRM22229.1 hypothetical protein [Pseudomonas sp. 28 E 9]
MLAKNVNNNACFLNERGACEFFASKLAPTEGGGGLLPIAMSIDTTPQRPTLTTMRSESLLILGAPLNHAGRTQA